MPGAEDLELLGCSPWRDRSGQHHMAARHGGGVANHPLGLAGPIELVRYTFPEGKVVDRAVIDPVPRGSICWVPDRSDRIVFAAGDGRLYRYDFPHGDECARRPGESGPEPLSWGGADRRNGKPWLLDPCWPDEPTLGGQMLVALVPRDSGDRRKPSPKSQLWWVQTDSAVRNIIAAHRAIIPDGVSPDVEERLPNVGRAADGRLLLAYLFRPPGRYRWELWVAPIACDRAVGPPTVLASDRRRLAGECEAVVPSFSPDGRCIFAALHDARSGVRVQGFGVPGSGDRSRHGRDPITNCCSGSRGLPHQRRETRDRSG
jgi:hypothetical protein